PPPWTPLPRILLSENSENAVRFAAERHPDDFQIQLGFALREGPPDSPEERNRPFITNRLERLRALRQRFPNRPALYAALLRVTCPSQPLYREENYLLMGTPTPALSSSKPFFTQ